MKKKLDVTSYILNSENLPASFDGCRIGFLTDLHDNEIGVDNEGLINRIKKQTYDFFLCCGDMIVGSDKGIFEYQNALKFFEKIAKIAPVYYSLGNHEERMRKAKLIEENDTLDTYKEALLNRNVTVLDNETITLSKEGENICIKGISLSMDYYKRWWNRKSLSDTQINEMIGKKKEFTILLAHNPVFFETYDSYGTELILSGHVHGGLMVLPILGGVISPELKLFPKYDFGYFEGNTSKMILSRGLGTHTLPIRIHNRPEFIDITLKRACDFSGQLVE